MERIELPASLRGIFFDRTWETSKVWTLPTPPTHAPVETLVWHLDLTVWITGPGEPRLDFSPKTVLDKPEDYPGHWKRILGADLSFPLEMFRNCDRWVILDGYNRLARHVLEGRKTVSVRLHPAGCWSRIQQDT